MYKRILLAGMLGGIALFLWEGLAHEVLPLGHAGIRAAPNEAAFITGVKEQIKESGFYFFPAPEERPGASTGEKTKAMEAWMQKWKAGPSGIMIVQPNGAADADSPRQLLTQCGFDIVVMLLAAVLLSRTTLGGYVSRVGFVTVLALFAFVHADLPYWNWYAFPAAYTAAQFVTRVVGFFVGGLVVAKFVRGA